MNEQKPLKYAAFVFVRRDPEQPRHGIGVGVSGDAPAAALIPEIYREDPKTPLYNLKAR